MTEKLTLALSKGRILKETLPLLAQAGIELAEEPGASRKLILPTNQPDLQVVIVRATDVPTYVSHGGADFGVVGKDVLMEHGADGLYEPLDLEISRCRISVAGDHEPQGRGRLRVATKYVNIAKQYFSARGQQVDIIKLYGSMELAPIVGMADVIVDLVDTGNTLRANGLRELQPITQISSRMVVNRSSMKLHYKRLTDIFEKLQLAVDGNRAAD